MAKSIQQAVNEILQQRTDLLAAMKLDLVNGNALARQIKSKVERMTRQKVKLNTITVAIKRYQKRMSKMGKYTASIEIDVAEIVTRTPLYFYSFENDVKTAMYFTNLFGVPGIKEKLASYYMDSTKIYVAFSPDIAEKINASKGKLISAIEDAAMFGLRLNQEIEGSLTQKISEFVVNNGIEVYATYSNIKDLVFIINKKYLTKFIESFS